MSILVAIQPTIGPVLVAGGGAVAARKVASLVESGFQVIVVAPAVSEVIASLPVTVERRAFVPSDLEHIALAFACTDDRAVNRHVGELCRAARIPVLVADSPAESTFYSLATHHEGDIEIGVGTQGSGPRLAAAIRDELAGALDPAWQERVVTARSERAPQETP